MVKGQIYYFNENLMILKHAFSVGKPRGGGHSLVSSVPMRDQKNDEKGYFFSRRAVRSADII